MTGRQQRRCPDCATSALQGCGFFIAIDASRTARGHGWKRPTTAQHELHASAERDMGMTNKSDNKSARHRIDRRAFLKAGVSAVAVAGAVPSFDVFMPSIARAAALKPEKEDLKFGFIKLTDMAPIAVAKELGYFEDEGLYVAVEPQANWKVLLDRVITGELDGAHMRAGQPIGATIGFGTKAHVITPFSMDLNGNGITVANSIWEQMKPFIALRHARFADALGIAGSADGRVVAHAGGRREVIDMRQERK
jgi:hypothetical protein